MAFIYLKSRYFWQRISLHHFLEKWSKFEQLKQAFEGPHSRGKSITSSQTDPVGTACLIDFSDKAFISWRAHKQ